MPSQAVKPRLNRIVRSLGVSHDFVYRDWALAHILAGIAASEALSQNLVFKGGTALRKCLVPNWRYSVDLDFSSLQQYDCGELQIHLETAIPFMVQSAQAVGQLVVTVERVEHRDPHPGGQCQFILRITIPGGSMTQAKIEVSMDEPVLLAHSLELISHLYPPEPDSVGRIRCYAIDEIATEKLRAYLQSRKHLGEHGWAAGRSRDTFDLAMLHRAGLVDPIAVAGILFRKCAARGVTFTSLEDFRDPAVRRIHTDDWDKALLPTLPKEIDLSCKQAFSLVDDLLRAVFGTSGRSWA